MPLTQGRSCLQEYILSFGFLVHHELYDPGDSIHRLALVYIWSKEIQRGLDLFADAWNHHAVCRCTSTTHTSSDAFADLYPARFRPRATPRP
jgi:hypothetical protein